MDRVQNQTCGKLKDLDMDKMEKATGGGLGGGWMKQQRIQQ